MAQTVYGFSGAGLPGTGQAKIDLNDYQGQVMIIVNSASKWGCTNRDYKQLNEIYEKYHPQGLEIICQPSNQIGSQEPLPSDKLWASITEKYQPAHNNFFDKADVNGKNATPLFQFLQSHPNCKGFMTNSIKWNWTKFLIDRNGIPIKRWGTKDSPSSMTADIEAALAASSTK